MTITGTCTESQSHDDVVLCFDFCAEARNWFCGSSESTLKKLVMVHHQQTVTTERQDDLCQLTKGGIGEIRIRPDQRIVATGGWDKRYVDSGIK